MRTHLAPQWSFRYAYVILRLRSSRSCGRGSFLRCARISESREGVATNLTLRGMVVVAVHARK